MPCRRRQTSDDLLLSRPQNASKIAAAPPGVAPRASTILMLVADAEEQRWPVWRQLCDAWLAMPGSHLLIGHGLGIVAGGSLILAI